MTIDISASLSQKIADRSARIGVIGLGYVGLPLATTFGRNGFNVLGVDVDERKIAALMRDESYIEDVTASVIAPLRQSGRFAATTLYAPLQQCDVIFICVPTPMTAQKAPDLSFIEAATRGIAAQLRTGQLIILQSTTYPGTTEEFVLPTLSATGLMVGADFFLAFSPERIDPGHTSSSGYDFENTPKVVGGVTPHCTRLAAQVLGQLIAKVHIVSSPRAAELCKLLENTFRSVNIALVNELALLCERMGIDVWEVIDAARTKPYGFMPFYPGAGVGGHCVSPDEFLFIRNSKGLRTVRFGDYFSELEKSQPECVRLIGDVKILDLSGVDVLSFDTHRQRVCYKPLITLSRRTYYGSLVNITTTDRRALTVTDGHPMPIWANNSVSIKPAAALCAGDQLILLASFPESATSALEVDLIAHLSDKSMNGIRVAPTKELFQNFCTQLWPALKTLCATDPYEIFRSNQMPLSLYLTLERQGLMPIPHQDVRLRTGRGPSASSIPAVIKLDERFARLIGYYLSEGCITRDKSLRTRFTFNSNELEYIDDVCIALDELGIRYSKHQDKTYRALQIKVSSNLFALLLRDILQCGTRSTEMSVPMVLLNASASIRRAVLEGLLRGDGDVDLAQRTQHYFSKKKQKHYNHHINVATVGYFSSSPILFQQTLLLAHSLGFIPTLKKGKPYFRLYGQGQLAQLTDYFDGAKRIKLEQYTQGRNKTMPTKSFKRYDGFATVAVKELTNTAGVWDVYSAEVADTHTFVTSYGLVTHNCIPIDPYYLSWKAREYDFYMRFIEFAADTNQLMPNHVVERVTQALNRHGKHLNHARILILGVAFKANTDDARNSPAERVMELLHARGAQLTYSDPHVPQFHFGNNVFQRQPVLLQSQSLTPQVLAACDCAVIIAAHRAFDYEQIVTHAPLIVDTANATKHIQHAREKIVRIGAPL